MTLRRNLGIEAVMADCVSRRTLLRTSAFTAAGVAAAAVVSDPAAAHPLPKDGHHDPGLATVVGVGATHATVSLQAGSSATYLMHGFPDGYAPLIGERVMLSDDLGDPMVFPLVAVMNGELTARGTVEIRGHALQLPAKWKQPHAAGDRVRAWISRNVETRRLRVAWARTTA